MSVTGMHSKEGAQKQGGIELETQSKAGRGRRGMRGAAKTLAAKCIAVLVAVMMTTSLVPAAAMAQVAASPIVAGTGEDLHIEMQADEVLFGGGDGSEGSPYLIGTAEHLVELSEKVNTEKYFSRAKYFRLTADINMNDLGEDVTFTSIGKAGTLYDTSTNFNGHFDGSGYAIKSLKTSLFGATNSWYVNGTEGNSTIHDLTLANCDVTGSGALAGNATKSTIYNIKVQNSTIASSGDYCGGLVGNASGCTVRNAKAQATVTATKDSSYCGGIIGYASASSKMSDVIMNGSVTGKQYTGGIVGFSYGITLEHTVNHAAVTQKDVTGTSNQYGAGGG